METTIILPVLDTEKLQQKANEYAMQGALKTLEEYYTGYNSPYRKAIEEKLNQKGLAYNFELPDIIASLNESLSAEVEKLANTAITQSYLPMVKKFLTRAPEKMLFSEVLKEFINAVEPEDFDDLSIEMEQSTAHKWYSIVIRHKDAEYHLTLYQNSSNKKEEKETFKFLSLPNEYRGDIGKSYRTVKITWPDGAAMEVPYTRAVLEDKFVAFIARLVMSETIITIDQTDFWEDMMPERCHC